MPSNIIQIKLVDISVTGFKCCFITAAEFKRSPIIWQWPLSFAWLTIRRALGWLYDNSGALAYSATGEGLSQKVPIKLTAVTM